MTGMLKKHVQHNPQPQGACQDSEMTVTEIDSAAVAVSYLPKC